MSQPAESRSPETASLAPDTTAESDVRKSAVILAAITLAFACVATTYLEFQARSAHMAMSNLPLTVLLPFVFWLLANTLLKRFHPRFSLTSSELRVLLCILWVGGSFAGYNWITQWVGVMSAPRYYASPENRWVELIFQYLPWWMYPSDFPGVVEGFFLGIGEGDSLPWGAWITPLFWAASAALAMTAIGLGITAIFQKQWSQHERLVYPLAQVSLDITEGFDRKRGWPPFVRSWMFWAGFTIAAFPLLWNITEYFVTGFPRISIWDAYYSVSGPRGASVSRYLTPLSYRLLPTVVGFTFLCDLNILFSIWFLWVVGLVSRYWMNRVGVSIGLAGQEAKTAEILGLFGHGVMIGLVIYAIWVARGHLKRVALQILHPPRQEDEETVILSPRVAALAILCGGTFMIFWLYAAGYSLAMSITWMILLWASILAVMKYLAASGFGYMFPNWGTAIPQIWVGTNSMTESTLVTMRVINSRLLPGWRLPLILPHLERLLGPGRRVGALVFGSVLLGLLSAAIYTIWLCYEHGGTTFRTWSLVGAPVGMYNGIATVVTETSQRTVTDPAKISVWALGGVVSGLLTFLQSRFTWWPLHPLGLFLMFSGYVRLYALDIFFVWLAKLMVLQFGGILLYRRVRPCCYGLIVGYLFAVGCSFLVDYIWFPAGGHYIHGY